MRFLTGFVIAGLLMSGVAVGQQYKVGDEVVVIQNAEIRVPAANAERAWPGLVLMVEAVNGRSLWVNNGKAGWIDSAFVVPLDRNAVQRLTNLIQSQPTARAL